MIKYKITLRGDARNHELVEQQRNEIINFAKHWLLDTDEMDEYSVIGLGKFGWEEIEYEFEAGMPQKTLLEEKEHYLSHAKDYAPNCKSYKIIGDGWEINSIQTILHGLTLIPGEIKKAEAKASGKHYQDVAMSDINRDIEDWEEDHNIIYATDVETGNTVCIIPNQVVAMRAESYQDQTPAIRIYTTGGHSFLVDARYFDREWRSTHADNK